MWIATSDDVPGLVLEHGSFSALLERVRLAVPELLAMDDALRDGQHRDSVNSELDKALERENDLSTTWYTGAEIKAMLRL